MSIFITTRKQHPVTDEALYALMQDSYQQWTDAGIQAQWLYRSLDEFKVMLRHATVVLAIDIDSNKLLGMHCFHCYRKQYYAYGFYLGVASQAKHQGIASQMLQYAQEQLRARGYYYLQGVTEVTAVWSVRWHLKNGYRIIGYHHAKPPYSAKYSFRLQLAPSTLRHPSSLLWNRPLAPITAKIRLALTYIYTLLRTHGTDSPVRIGDEKIKFMNY